MIEDYIIEKNGVVIEVLCKCCGKKIMKRKRIAEYERKINGIFKEIYIDTALVPTEDYIDVVLSDGEHKHCTSLCVSCISHLDEDKATQIFDIDMKKLNKIDLVGKKRMRYVSKHS